MKSLPTPVTRTLTRPSSISSSCPGAIAAKISGCGSGIDICVAVAALSTKRIGRAFATLDLAVLDGADADLGSLQVHAGCRSAARRPSPARGSLAWTFAWSSCESVTEVEPERVDAGQEQRLEHLGRGAGRVRRWRRSWRDDCDACFDRSLGPPSISKSGCGVDKCRCASLELRCWSSSTACLLKRIKQLQFHLTDQIARLQWPWCGPSGDSSSLSYLT